MSRAADLWDKAARYRRLAMHVSDEKTKAAMDVTIRDLERQAADLVAGPNGEARSETMREFYASTDGDRWSLALGDGGLPIVVHQANPSSGGHETEWQVDTFLTTHHRDRPEHEALLRIIGSLVTGA